MDKKKVLVIFGGSSSEHEVSLRSAAFVINNIPREKFEVVCIGITKTGKWKRFGGDIALFSDGSWENDASCVPAVLSPDSEIHGIVVQEKDKSVYEKIDVIFPVLHGKNGEDGTIQGLFELSTIPYVGCKTLSSAVCMDKAVTHSLLSLANIDQARYIWFYAKSFTDNPGEAAKIKQSIESSLNFPVFIKPANAGSSVGISKVLKVEDIDAAVIKAAKEDSKIVVEEGIVGQEVECAIMGNEDAIASTVGEIGATAEFYDYDDKYNNGTSQIYIPAHLSEEKIQEIREIAVSAYKLLGCRGLSRVDFFVKEDGTVLLNEINTLPGFTSISMYPKLWEASGVNAKELMEKLIDYALK